MSDELRSKRLEVKAIVVGYAMSRLDARYLAKRKLKTWQLAYAEASQALLVPPASFKNVRDEFDPIHPNERQGWKYPIRPNRQRVLEEVSEISDEALMELVSRILQHEEESISEAIDDLASVNRITANVAERLLTGRRAEEYFQLHSQRLVNIASEFLVDMRQSARGYDFGVRGDPEQVFEVKGLKRCKGGIQFTDREWHEANLRRDNYLLIVVGNLMADPLPRVIRDPYSTLSVTCAIQTSITAVWKSTVAVS